MILTCHFSNNTPASPAVSRHLHKSPILAHQASNLEPSFPPLLSFCVLMWFDWPIHRYLDLCPHSNRFSLSLPLLPVFKTVIRPACSSNSVPTFPMPLLPLGSQPRLRRILIKLSHNIWLLRTLQWKTSLSQRLLLCKQPAKNHSPKHPLRAVPWAWAPFTAGSRCGGSCCLDSENRGFVCSHFWNAMV